MNNLLPTHLLPTTWPCLRAVLAPLMVLGALGALPAAASPPNPAAREATLRAHYDKALADPALAELERQAQGPAASELAEERYLAALPLSPLEIFRIDGLRRHLALPVPRGLVELHRRWLQRHEADARALYGDAEVNAWLGAGGENPTTGRPGLRATTVGTNRNAAAGDSPAPLDYQGEIQVAVDPDNPQRLVAAANSWDDAGCGDGMVATFFSGDGGASWGYRCAPGPAAFTPAFPACPGQIWAADPALAWNDEGEVYLAYMLICRVSSGDDRAALVIARSLDGGDSWQARGVIKNSWNAAATLEDKPFYAIDNLPQSPTYGRHYVCWDRAKLGDNQAKLAYSTNDGTSWTEKDLPTAPTGDGIDNACDLVVAKDGTVHMIWGTLSCLGDTCHDEQIYATRFDPTAGSFSAPVLVRDLQLSTLHPGTVGAQDQRGIGPFGALALDTSGGPCDGTLYAAFGDYEADNYQNGSDIFVTRSTNAGASWSTPVRVNDEPPGLILQFHPSITVDPTQGTLVAAWYDARNDPQNRALDVYLSRSTDCGLSFAANTRVTAPSAEFNASGTATSTFSGAVNGGVNPNQTGEYLGLDARGGKAFVAWTDTRHYFPGFASEPQKENLAFATVSFDPISKSFASQAQYDGYILESGENTGVGGTLETASNLRLGDQAVATHEELQYRSVLSFNTAALPDAAAILSAKVTLAVSTVTGTDPLITHGPCVVDVKRGVFGQLLFPSTQLELVDFAANATAASAGTLASVGHGSVSASFDSAGRGAVNRSGTTQVRLRCTLDDNDDSGSDFLELLTTHGAQPQLTVTYQ